MLRLILGAAVLATAVPAAAEDWRLVRVVGTTPGRSAVLIDAASIDRTVAAMPTFKTAMLLEGGMAVNGLAKPINQIISFQRIDCAANTIRVLNTDAHARDGAFLLSDTNQMTQDILPGQPAAVYRQAVCEKQWAPETRTTGNKPLSTIHTEVLGA